MNIKAKPAESWIPIFALISEIVLNNNATFAEFNRKKCLTRSFGFNLYSEYQGYYNLEYFILFTFALKYYSNIFYM